MKYFFLLCLLFYTSVFFEEFAAKAQHINQIKYLIPDSNMLRKHISTLANDSLEGRETGTKGFKKAAQYIIGQFTAFGFNKIGKQQIQNVPMNHIEVNTSNSFIELATANGNRKKFSLNKDYFLPGDFSQLQNVNAPVVFVGYGLTIPGRQYDDYKGLNVKEKIVAYLPGVPKDFSLDEKTFYGESKSQNAIQHGAIATLIIAPNINESISSLSTLLRYNNDSGNISWLEGKEQNGITPRLKASAQIGTEISKALFSQTSISYDEAISKAIPIVLPLKVRVQTKITISNTVSQNIIGIINGTDPSLSKEYVVVSAHLDHLGIGKPVNGDSIYNGAVDNASGVATLMEIARFFASSKSKPKRSIIFVVFTGEEPGNIGSDYFVHHCPFLKNIIADINIDGSAVWEFNGIIPRGAEHSTLSKLAEAAAVESENKIIPDPIPGRTSLAGSDQFSFITQGIPSIIVGAGRTENSRPLVLDWVKNRYHKPSDDINQPLSFSAVSQFTDYLISLTRTIANERVKPKWNSDDFYGKIFKSN